jgi:hypothetical protein
MGPQQYHAPLGTENAALLEAMAEDAAGDNLDARKHLYKALLDSTLLFVVESLPIGVANGGIIRGARNLVFPCGKQETGEKFTAAFTGEDSLRAWDPKRPFVRLRTQTLLRMIQPLDLDECYINPFHAGRQLNPGGWLTRREIDVLSAGIIPERAGPHHFELRETESDKIEIHPPATPLSPGVAAALVACAREIESIFELLYVGMSINSEAKHGAIGLGLDPSAFPSQAESIVPKLMARVQPLLGDREMLDIVPYAVPNSEMSVKGLLIYKRG